MAVALSGLLTYPFTGRAAVEFHDPLWEKARAHMRTVQEMTAAHVLTTTAVYDSSNVYLGKKEESVRITGWKAGRPIRKSEWTKVDKNPGASISLELFVHSRPAALLAISETAVIERIERRADETVAEKDCGVFAFRYTTGRTEKGKTSYSTVAWVEKATGLPVRVKSTILKVNVSGLKSAAFVVDFAWTGKRQWLPLRCATELSGSMMFVTRNVKIQQEFTEWIQRPVTASPAGDAETSRNPENGSGDQAKP